MPFDIPDNWTWIRLKNTSELLGGYAFKSEKFSPNGIRVFRISDFDEKGIKNKDIKRYPYSKDLDQYKIFQNDILMCMTGGTVGKSTLIKEIFEDSYINQRVALIRIKHIDIKYFYCLILSSYISNIVHENKTSTNDNISMKLIEDFLLPLPPLEEQQRIVDKINSFDPLLQEYETYEKKLTELESTFADKLKKSILQYAIEGKLVKQDPNDEPASVLLERIKAEKEKLIKEGKIKRDKNESYIYQGDDKNYYENLPNGWVNCSMGKISIIQMGQSPNGNSYGNTGIEFHQGKTYFGAKILSNSNVKTSAPTKMTDNNSIIMSVRAPVGDINMTDRPICIGRGLCSIKYLGGDSQAYLYYMLLTLKKYFIANSTGTTFKAVNADIIINTPISLPPINEQKRIIKKLNIVLNYI